MSARTATNGVALRALMALRPSAIVLALSACGALALPLTAAADEANPTVKDLGKIDAKLDMAKRQADLRTLQGKGGGEGAVSSQAAPMTTQQPVQSGAQTTQARVPTTPVYTPPPIARTPENEGMHLRAVFGVAPAVKAVVLLGDGSYQRVSVGDVVTGWRVVTVAPGALVLTQNRVVKTTTGKGKSRKVTSKAASNGHLFVVKIDPPQSQVNAAGSSSGSMMGGRNSLFAEPLGSLPNPNLRNINQTIPTNPLPRTGGSAPAPSGLVGVGTAPGSNTPPTSNLSNQTLPTLQPSTDDTSSQPSSLNIER